jgi:ribonuclease M5
MLRIKEALVVEGKYDKNTLSQIIDAPIFVTDGFGIFKDPEKLALLRAAAEKRGLIILTDSDGAGFVIRGYLKGAIPPELVKQAYIPDVCGKEKRKAAPGKEGKLGVEGMKPEVLIAALRNAGATFLDESAVGASIARPTPADPERNDGTSNARPYEAITKTDLYELGLSGRPDSREKRLALQKRLGLPENMSANALLTALNCLYTKEELEALLWHPESSTWQSPTK